MSIRDTIGRVSPSAKLVAMITVIALLVWPVTTVWESVTTERVSLRFADATGLYVGDPAKLRGVTIGKVLAIEPNVGDVVVAVSFDRNVDIDAAAGAAIVSPTLVSGRYVQFANPAKRTGEKLTTGATIELARTAVPVGYDDVKTQVTDLARQLGPRTADSEDRSGALSELVGVSATKLRGSGDSFRAAVQTTSDAATTLAASGPDLFSAVRSMQTLVTALRASDDEIVMFARELRAASNLLDDNRTQLDAAVRAVNGMAPQLESFLEENRDALAGDITALTKITGLLVDRQDSLAQILHVTPTALDNLYNIYDPRSNSLTGALAVSDYPDPMSLICALLTTVDAPRAECKRAGDTLRRGLADEVVKTGVDKNRTPRPAAAERGGR